MATALAPQSDAMVSPAKLAHVVLRTSKFREILDWYQYVLNATPAFENEHIAFLTYDDEHHRIAVINIPDLAPPPDGIAGVHHVAFTYDRMTDLFDNYARLRDRGILPSLSINHGPTTSLYYEDPDGNQLEFQIENFETVEESGQFFFSDAFAVNPIGVNFDPEDTLRRLRAGEDEAELKKRPVSGARGVDDIGLR